MEELNTLELRRRDRIGGGGRTERSYLDFVVDGRSLLDLLGPQAGDTCGCLGWGDLAWQARAVRRLRLEDPLQIAAEREPLFVCPECGDLGCGAVTATITAFQGVVKWANFAFENTWADPEPIAGIGPFRFEFRAYRLALEAAVVKP